MYDLLGRRPPLGIGLHDGDVDARLGHGSKPQK
jgi:hypothetical protein